MNKILLTTLTTSLITTSTLSQNYGEQWTIEATAVVQESPAQISLVWEPNVNTAATTFLIFRKVKGTVGWGNSIASLPNAKLTYTDLTAVAGVSYEYHIQYRTGNTIYAWGFVNAGIKTELNPNKGDILLMVDNSFINGLSTKITELEEDLYNDGWNVKTVSVDPTDSPSTVKSEITTQYNALPNLKTVYFLGNIPVAYSGNIKPDGHPAHEGAWPTDLYYADIDGSWTDNSVNNTVATDTRNQNIPGDGKFDQSTVPSELEIEICRVDMSQLSDYSDSEEALLSKYLTRAHEFKTAQYIPQEKGLIDVGDFAAFQDGFTQNGYRNFTAFFGSSGIDELDYYTTLTANDYLWSYGCGAGNWTSAQGLNNGNRMYTSDLATNGINTTFTMLFGSYFGDWDRNNNLIKGALASGKVLASAWVGRPNFHYHNMASGDHLGSCAKLSQDFDTEYLSINYGASLITIEGVHVTQFGDPSLRMCYLAPASNLMVTNNANVADLTWTASTDVSIDGYNVYRKDPNTNLWVKVNTSIITGTSYSDNTIPSGGDFEFMVKSVKLKNNSSGSFYNESIGTTDTEVFSVGINVLEKSNLIVYPNPSNGVFQVTSQMNMNSLKVFDVSGKLVLENELNSNFTQINLTGFKSGLYTLVSELDNGGSITRKLIVK